jgi:hypothetical protein
MFNLQTAVGLLVTVALFGLLMMIGYIGNAIIPLRPDDLVRAYLLRHGIAVSTTLSTVVVERFFDVAAIVIIDLH